MFQLLSEERFSCIEKIKTTGYTYMAAAGLLPSKTGSSNSSNGDKPGKAQQQQNQRGSDSQNRASGGGNAAIRHSTEENVVALADYALALRKQLQYVNEHSFNHFKLRLVCMLLDILPGADRLFAIEWYEGIIRIHQNICS